MLIGTVSGAVEGFLGLGEATFSLLRVFPIWEIVTSRFDLAMFSDLISEME